MSDHLAEKLVIAFVTTRREPGNTHEQTGMQRREHANRRGEDVRMKLSGSISSMTVDFPMAGIHMTSFRSGVDAEMMTWVEDETDVDSEGQSSQRTGRMGCRGRKGQKGTDGSSREDLNLFGQEHVTENGDVDFGFAGDRTEGFDEGEVGGGR
jgi:hypothetical protein